jgi:antitoxin component YwqK of YwqJK toxin-antitoxin module
VRGHLHGVAKVFDELGSLKEEMTLEHGLRHGAYRRYNKGLKVLEAVFEQNRCVKNCDF